MYEFINALEFHKRLKIASAIVAEIFQSEQYNMHIGFGAQILRNKIKAIHKNYQSCFQSVIFLTANKHSYLYELPKLNHFFCCDIQFILKQFGIFLSAEQLDNLCMEVLQKMPLLNSKDDVFKDTDKFLVTLFDVLFYICLREQWVEYEHNFLNPTKFSKTYIYIDGNIGADSCKQHNHSMSEILALVEDLFAMQSPSFVKMTYCHDCGRYIAPIEIKFNFIPKLKYNPQVGDLYIKNTYSQLHMYGYSVDQTINLSTEKRRKILTTVIGQKVMTSQNIVDYLGAQIQFSKNRSNMQSAVIKWSSDLSYILNKYKP